jgi:iron(III) transport system substrate-binding protein
MRLSRFLAALSFASLLSIPVLSLAQDNAVPLSGETLTLYSGRSEDLIGPIIAQFTAETGVAVEVRYGNTAEMAAVILEEGDNSPADVYIAQDAGALGALAAAGRLLPLPSDILEKVPAAFSSDDGLWVGLSGRVRTLVYNTEAVSADELPASLLDLTGEAWTGRVGWAPTNASFQAHVTALRLVLGEDAAAQWLQDMVANGVVAYENNRAIVQAVIDGEVDAGLVNNYYLGGFLADNPDLPAANYFFPGGDIGSLVNVAGAGVVSTTDQPGLSQRLLLYLLGNDAQSYFTNETYEYPLVPGIPTSTDVVPLDQIEAPEIDLSDLSDLQTTLDLLSSTGALP